MARSAPAPAAVVAKSAAGERRAVASRQSIDVLCRWIVGATRARPSFMSPCEDTVVWQATFWRPIPAPHAALESVARPWLAQQRCPCTVAEESHDGPSFVASLAHKVRIVRCSCMHKTPPLLVHAQDSTTTSSTGTRQLHVLRTAQTARARGRRASAHVRRLRALPLCSTRSPACVLADGCSSKQWSHATSDR